jgi:hypothetical protein
VPTGLRVRSRPVSRGRRSVVYQARRGNPPILLVASQSAALLRAHITICRQFGVSAGAGSAISRLPLDICESNQIACLTTFILVRREGRISHLGKRPSNVVKQHGGVGESNVASSAIY